MAIKPVAPATPPAPVRRIDPHEQPPREREDEPAEHRHPDESDHNIDTYA